MIRLMQLILFFLMLVPLSLNAQVADFDWAVSTGGVGIDEAKSIATDKVGNVYVFGDFRDTVDFDPDTGILIKNSTGQQDCYLQKFDSHGKLIWARTWGGLAGEHSRSLAIDDSGYIYLAGEFHSTVDFDPGTNVFNLSATFFRDVYLLKLDSQGQFIWAKCFGGWNQVQVSDIKLVDSGGILMTGYFKDTVDFDPDTSSYRVIAKSADAYILKLDDKGGFVWVKTMGGPIGTAVPESIEADYDGNIIVVGRFVFTIDVDPDTSIFNISPKGSTGGYWDVFVLKYTRTGHLIWAHSMGSIGNDYAYSVATDRSNSIYLTGEFHGQIDLDPGSGHDYHSAKGNRDIFILKLDSSGSHEWGNTYGDTSFNAGAAVYVGADDKVYLAGTFSGTVDFDPGPDVRKLSTVSTIHYDVFLQKLNSNGALIWVKSISGPLSKYATSISLDLENNLFVAGHFFNQVDFDPGSGMYLLNSKGSADAFLVKLDQCDTNQSIFSVIACDDYTWIDGKTYSENNKTASFSYVNSDGCDSSFILHLVIDDIDTQLTVSKKYLRSNEFDASYQWYDCANGFIKLIGDTNEFFYPLKSGKYAVVIKENGCMDTSECVSFGPKGIFDQESPTDWRVYPNPFLRNVTISTDFNAFKISVFNVHSKLISEAYFDGNTTNELNIVGPAGVYFLVLEHNGQRETMRLVKKVTSH